jgi:hypothetical protein
VFPKDAGRGNATDVPANVTSTSEFNPLVTGSGKSPSGPTGWNKTDDGAPKKNATCGGCTINAQAGLDWWYPANIYQAIASVTTLTLNGTTAFSLRPAQTSIDVADEIAANGATFILTESYDPVADTTVDDYIFTTLPPPQAAETSIITISDVRAPPNTTFGDDFLGDMYTDPGIPSVVIPAATGTAFVASQPTNVVYYTAYEVETEESSTDASGQVYCGTSTATYQLPVPFAYEYDGTGLGDTPTQTGDVLEDFIAMVPQSSCVPGTWVAAAPVMIVVVEVTYQRGFSVFLVHHEVSDDGGLDTPAATTDDNPQPTDDGSGGVHVASVVGTVDGSVVTVPATVTGNPGAAVVTVGTSVIVGSVIGGSGNAGVASAIVQAIGGGTTQTGSGGVIANIIGALGGDTGSSAGSNSGSGSVNGIGFAETSNSNSGSGSTNSNSGSNSGSGSGAPVPVITVAGTTFVGNAATQFLLAPGQTLTPGGTATVGLNTVSLASGATAVVVNGKTSQLGAPTATQAPVLNIGGQVVTANSGGSFIVSGQTLTQGGQITIGSNTVSLQQGATGLVVNGQTITRPAVLASTGAPAITIDGSTVRAAIGGSSFIIAGQTLTPGGIIVANGNTISLGSGASSTIAVVNGVTQTLKPIVTPAAVNVAGTLFTELPGGSFVIQGQTLRPNSQITVAGTTLSLGPGASFIVVNGRTSSITLGTIPALVFGGTTYAATSQISGAFVIGGKTLTPGGIITLNGHTISLDRSDSFIVVDGSTSYFGVPASITNPPLITFAGHTYTANSGTTFIIDGQTLTPGGVITVHGTTISLAAHATAIVINGKTTALFPATNIPQAVSAIATSTATNKPKAKTTQSPTGSVKATATKKGAASALTSASVPLTAAIVALIATIQLWI